MLLNGAEGARCIRGAVGDGVCGLVGDGIWTLIGAEDELAVSSSLLELRANGSSIGTRVGGIVRLLEGSSVGSADGLSESVDGCSVSRLSDGADVSDGVGDREGTGVGLGNDTGVGDGVGDLEGIVVGLGNGAGVGDGVGDGEGTGRDTFVGIVVGDIEGMPEGITIGTSVGTALGCFVGTTDGIFVAGAGER